MPDDPQVAAAVRRAWVTISGEPWARMREAYYQIPKPCGGPPSLQLNDVEIDGRGLSYLADRNIGLDIREMRR